MSSIAGCLLFGWVVGTLIVPAGARVVGNLIIMLGQLIHEHGVRLACAYDAYKRGKV